MDTSELLEDTLLMGTPQEAAAFFKDHCKKVSPWRALATAIRYCGPEYVKALVESGAVLRNKGKHHYIFALLDKDKTKYYQAFLCPSERKFYRELAMNLWVFEKEIGRSEIREMLPLEQRVEIVKYLSENGERVCFDSSELLFYSIMSNDKEMTAALKEMGVTLSEKRIAAFVESRRFAASEMLYYSIMNNDKKMIAAFKKMGMTFSEKRIAILTESRRGAEWRKFCGILYQLEDGDCFEVLQNVVKEVGEKKLHFPEEVLGFELNPEFNRSYYSVPEKFGFILEHFDQKQMSKMAVMVCAINADSAGCLEICTKHGWLTKPSERDALIEYASKENRTECLAFLLDYKNRNFDLAAEREKAEKKAQRELNASPGSTTALRHSWRWKKQDDGTIVITSYIGSSTVIYVPSKVGRSIVASIGQLAFAYFFKKPWSEIRSKITKVVLPDGIKSIGYNAFTRCYNLENINIPDGVVRIDEWAFSSCNKLTEVFIPDSVREMGKSVFSLCSSLQAVRLSESMEEIPPHMFWGCSDLRRITLPGGIRRIGDEAFGRCESLEEVVIPASVTEIGKDIFRDSEKVIAVVEPNSFAEEYCKQNNIPFRHGTPGTH